MHLPYPTQVHVMAAIITTTPYHPNRAASASHLSLVNSRALRTRASSLFTHSSGAPRPIQNKTKKNIDDPWHLPSHPPQSHII